MHLGGKIRRVRADLFPSHVDIAVRQHVIKDEFEGLCRFYILLPVVFDEPVSGVNDLAARQSLVHCRAQGRGLIDVAHALIAVRRALACAHLLPVLAGEVCNARDLLRRLDIITAQFGMVERKGVHAARRDAFRRAVVDVVFRRIIPAALHILSLDTTVFLCYSGVKRYWCLHRIR